MDEMVGQYTDRVGKEHDVEHIKVRTNLICKISLGNRTY